MIEVQVPRDIYEYEPTLFGPLTMRGAGSVAVAAAVEYVYYLVLGNLGITLASLNENGLPLLIGILLAAPALYIGFAKPYGMRPEVYLYYFLLPSLLAPKVRPYATKLTYDSILEELDKMEAKAAEQQPAGGKNGKNRKGAKAQADTRKKEAKKRAQKKKKARGRQYKMYA